MAPPQDDPRNPFESFRRFADEQMSFLMRSLTGNPPGKSTNNASETSESDEDLPWIVQGMSEEARRRYRKVQRDIKDFSASQNAAEERSKAHRDEHLRCPYRPTEQEVPPSHQNSGPPQDNPYYPFLEFSNVGHDAEDELGFHGSSTWPVRYLLTSSYSPLYLEKQFPFRDQEQRWRHAFEDLIALQSGMNMESHDSPRPNVCATQWIGSLINRGIFGSTQAENEALRTGEPFGTLFPPEVGLGIVRLLRAQAKLQELRDIGGELDQADDEDDGTSWPDVCPAIMRLLGAQSRSEEQQDKAEEFVGQDEGYKTPMTQNVIGAVRRLLLAQERNEELHSRGKEADEDDEEFCGFDDDDDMDDDEDEEEAMTELDLYERMTSLKDGILGKESIERLASQAFRHESRFGERSTSTKQATADGKPSIISTLTTTERTTHPDGSVHTKMVLKKRFADGREESTETTQMTKDQQVNPQQQMTPEVHAARNGTSDDTEKTNPKSRGWFWS